MPNWLVQQFRLTMFPHDSEIEPIESWMEVIGEEPDKIDQRPKQNQLLITGKYKQGVVNFELHADRINWIYRMSSVSEDSILSLGAFDSAIVEFREITDKWFALVSCPSASRIAFGAVLRVPVNSRQEGYEILSELLPFFKYDEHATDFMYQINRPAFTRWNNSELKINRLSKWNVHALVQENILIGTTSIQALVSNAQELQARLELDTNTDQEYSGVFNPQEQQLILVELIQQSKAISEKGEAL